ncbi:hypothetical protein AB1L42_20225 [Thalassoglobus sp. JC818]|uniref:hypothetical protein n=1 Tax=Thalassoglobus sp. JC818 TaxID=3232136 RepID=UPI00345A32C7
MRFEVRIESPPGGQDNHRPVQIGWLLNDTSHGVIFEPPKRVRTDAPKSIHAKSACNCPAIIGLESRMFQVSCPFDLQLEFERTDEGYPSVRDGLNASSAVRQLDEILVVVAEDEWRFPDRPMLQLKLPYLFISDEPVYMSQLGPFLHHKTPQLPGTMLGGRFPINIWPRPLMWAFEWHDVDQPVILRRGDPLFYVLFETTPQDRTIQLVEAKRTPELEEYLNLVTGAVNFVNQTFSLFEAAEKRRPQKLVEPVDR